jgi:hypothetical protein
LFLLQFIRLVWFLHNRPLLALFDTFQPLWKGINRKIQMKNKFLNGLVVSFALIMSGLANAGLIYGSQPTSGYPITVFDTDTGTTTVLGSSNYNLGLAFDNNNNLFGINNTSLYSIDLNNGAASFIGNGLWSGYSEAATFIWVIQR